MGKTDALEGLVQAHTVSGRSGIQHPNPFDATVLASSAPQASVSPDAQHLTCLCCCCWPGPVSSGKCTLLLMATLIYIYIYTLLYIPIISWCITANRGKISMSVKAVDTEKWSLGSLSAEKFHETANICVWEVDFCVGEGVRVVVVYRGEDIVLSWESL